LVFVFGLALASGCADEGECDSDDVRECECAIENQLGAQYCVNDHWESVCTCTPVRPGDGSGAGGGGGAMPPDAGSGADAGG
jgi:hypothetical protein